jgi:outer membrane protein assembly factor BamD
LRLSLSPLLCALLLYAATLCAAATLSACGTGRYKVEWDGPPKSEAEAAYRQGVEMMASGQYIDATQRFNYVRLKFPYSSRWTTLAELRLADLAFEQSRFLQAAELYAQFVKGHPSHEDVPYALLRAGDCFYEQMPGDLFILPDPWQRDLASTRQAEDAYRRFIIRYPDGDLTDKARARLLEVRERLARSELYIAEFYLKRDQPIGALNRLLTMAERYPSTPSLDRGLFLLAHSYILLKDPQAAASALLRLLQDYPTSALSPDAQRWLAQHNLTDQPPMPLGEDLSRARRPKPPPQ